MYVLRSQDASSSFSEEKAESTVPLVTPPLTNTTATGGWDTAGFDDSGWGAPSPATSSGSKGLFADDSWGSGGAARDDDDGWGTKSSLLSTDDSLAALSVEDMLNSRSESTDKKATAAPIKEGSRDKGKKGSAKSGTAATKSNSTKVAFAKKPVVAMNMDLHIEPRYIDVITEVYSKKGAAIKDDVLKDHHKLLAEKATKVYLEGGDLVNLFTPDDEIEAAKSASKKSVAKVKDDTAKGGGEESHPLQGEKFEKSSPEFKYFNAFSTRLKYEPSQMLRYAYNGKPLWPYPPPKNMVIPKCICGATRVFELQLLPTILLHYDVDIDSVDWATIVIYSCPDSCNKSDREWACIQMPDSVDYHRGKKLA